MGCCVMKQVNPQKEIVLESSRNRKNQQAEIIAEQNKGTPKIKQPTQQEVSEEQNLGMQRKNKHVQEKEISEQQNQEKASKDEQQVEVNVQQNQGSQRNDKNAQYLINKLYDKSWRLRGVEESYKPFIRQVQTMQDLKQNYSLNLQASKEIKQHFDQFIQVRGDGNCFYTAFGYQYLALLLKDQNKMTELINEIKHIKLSMKIKIMNDIEINNENDQTILRNDFCQRLQFINQKGIYEERIQELQKELQAYQQNEFADGCFYGLFMLFLRNYTDFIIEQSDLKDLVFDRENLLIWEKECNNNEVIIKSLADYFKVNIKLFFFQDKGFDLKEYGNEFKDSINLLMRPGHYNIGIQLCLN